jgi:TP901-1 family phage major tail protein
MTDYLNGSDVVLLANTGTELIPVYEVVACQRDVTFTETRDEIDVSSKCEPGRVFIPGRFRAEVSLDALYVPDNDAYEALKAAHRAGDLILIARQQEEVTVETALAMISSMTETFPDQDAGTISVSLTVSGMWEVVGS